MREGNRGNGRFWVNLASGIFFTGLAAQAAGAYLVWGPGAALAIVGTELAVIGLVGVLGHA